MRRVAALAFVPREEDVEARELELRRRRQDAQAERLRHHARDALREHQDDVRCAHDVRRNEEVGDLHGDAPRTPKAPERGVDDAARLAARCDERMRKREILGEADLLLHLRMIVSNDADVLFIRPDFAIPMVATRDIGLVAARALADGPPSARIDIVELAGPREFSPVEIANAFAKVVGRDVEPEAAPFEAVVPAFTSFGLSKSVAEAFEEMYRGIANGQVDWQGAGARLVRGSVDAETLAKNLVS